MIYSHLLLFHSGYLSLIPSCRLKQHPQLPFNGNLLLKRCKTFFNVYNTQDVYSYKSYENPYY